MALLSNGVGVWEHFTVEDGLPDMKIECIFEDSHGVLWVGTHDRGVVRYSGDEFKAFTVRDGLADSVFSILEDDRGCLWFGTNRGIIQFDGQGFNHIDQSHGLSVLWGSCIDSAGDIWFGVERRPGHPPAACRWRGQSLELVDLQTETSGPGRSIHKTVLDAAGNLWLGGDGLYVKVGDREFTEIDSSGGYGLDQVMDIFPEENGGIIVARPNGLRRYHDGGVELLFDEPYSPVSIGKRDGDPAFWIVSYDGELLRWNDGAVQKISQLDCVHRGGFCVSASGRLWVGTYGMGLFCYDDQRLRIYNEKHGLRSKAVQCVASDHAGRQWIGTKNGLSIWTEGSISDAPGSDILENTGITGLLEDSQGRVWVGTRTGWLDVIDRGEIATNSLGPVLEGHSIASLAEDKEGRIWFASPHGKGFGYLDDGGVHHFASEESSDYPSWVRALSASDNGGVWTGSSAPVLWDGLCRWAAGKWERIEGVSGVPILALAEDSDGRLWVGTNEGVICFDEDFSITFNQQDGLSCEIVTSIKQTSDKSMWIGTEGGGVCRYDGKVFQVIQIPSDAGCNVIHAIDEDPSGNIWLGTESGLVRYVPQHAMPYVEIVEVVADGIYPDPTEVQFSTSVGRTTFKFRGTSPLEHSAHLVYRFRLQGYDNEWRQAAVSEVDYPQLAPGSYVFEVQAVDRDLNYSKPATANLTVTPDPKIEALTRALSAERCQG